MQEKDLLTAKQNNSAASQAAPAENRMGWMPVNRLLLSMSAPMMASMLMQALYNIVDSIYVSRINENALTAVSLVFPVQTLMIAFATGIGVGFNSLLSRSLGAGDKQRVNKSATNGIFLELCAYLLFLLIGLTLPEWFMGTQTSDPEIFRYGVDYMRIVCCACIGVYVQMTFERILQATGKTLYTMGTQSLGAIINVIMDPILIFGYFGFPAMGVRGAALATIFGQVVAATIAILLNIFRNPEVNLSFRGFRPDREVIGQIMAVGLPSIVMQAIGSVMTYGMNRILIGFSSTATAVYGVYFKLNSFIFMPVFGLNNGLVPIVGYNYGAGKKERIYEALKYAWIYAVGLMFLGFLAFQFGSAFFLRTFFKASDHMVEIGVPALRIISISFPLAGYCIVCGSVFQALGDGVYSLIVSVLRQLVALLPVAYLLSLTGVLGNVWWSYVIAEVVSVAASTVFLKKMFRQRLSAMPSMQKGNS